MGSFSLTRAAKADLSNIARFTEKQWGRVQRRHYLKGLDDAFKMLSDSPEHGYSCDYIAPGLRRNPFQSHVIYYEMISDTEIQIVRVLHKRMDVRKAPFNT